MLMRSMFSISFFLSLLKLTNELFSFLKSVAILKISIIIPFSYEVAVFGFGHAETLAPLYAALGLYNDEPQLKADNFQLHRNRKFRSSRVLPFSANFAVALYQCDSGEDVEDYIEYVVRFYANEKTVDIPACGQKVCSYKKVREFYKNYVDDCKFHQMCRNPEPKGSNKHEEL